jgi:hypothetical protein
MFNIHLENVLRASRHTSANYHHHAAVFGGSPGCQQFPLLRQYSSSLESSLANIINLSVAQHGYFYASQGIQCAFKGIRHDKPSNILIVTQMGEL